jgi:hypothetical protein
MEGDTGVVDTIAQARCIDRFSSGRDPRAVHVLDVDRNACWTPVAVKGAWARRSQEDVGAGVRAGAGRRAQAA